MTNKEAIKLIQEIEEDGRNVTSKHLEALDLAIKVLEERPQGKWIEEAVPIGLVGRGNGQYRCSNCKHGDIQAKTQEVPYCWYCGAKMDKKEADNE